MTLSLDDLIATSRPRTTTVRVCGRGDLVDRHALLVTQLEAALGDSLAPSEDAREIAAQIVAVEEEQEAFTKEFTIRSVSRNRWSNLLRDHPPRKEDRGLDHDPVMFPPAAVSACCASPELSVEDVNRLADALPPGEWKKLWMATVALNVQETPHPKLMAATELVRASGDS